MDNNDNLQDYRLDTMDKKLDSLTSKMETFMDAMNGLKIQFEKMSSDTSDLLKLEDAINSHDKRIRKLELAPAEHGAARWNYIIDYTFKALVAAGVGFILMKVGLK